VARLGRSQPNTPIIVRGSLVIFVTLTDTPGAVQAAVPGQSLTTDVYIADGATLYPGGSLYPDGTLFPGSIPSSGDVQLESGAQTFTIGVNLADHAGAAFASRPSQSLVVDRLVSDRPTGATASGGPGQILVIDVIRADRPGAVLASGPATGLARNVTVTDRAGAAVANSVGQTVSGALLVGWPPKVTGPFYSPLFRISGPH
jgi:hypothetical protein